MQIWRLVKTKRTNGAMQMAIDEAITIACSEKKSPPTIRFYSFNSPAITLGHNQKIAEFDLRKVRRKGFDVVRRITGGAAVLHKNDLVYSLVIPENFLPEKVIDAYNFLSDGLVEGLKRLGVKAGKKVAISKNRQASCYLNENPYDVVVNNKKISGNAQARIKGVVLQQGTIIIEDNLSELFDCLGGDTCPQNNFLKQAREKITSLEKKLGKKPAVEEVEKAMIYGFKKLFSTKKVLLEHGRLTEEEMNLAEKLYQGKYATDQWNNQ